MLELLVNIDGTLNKTDGKYHTLLQVILRVEFAYNL